jgi:hypothetical protein
VGVVFFLHIGKAKRGCKEQKSEKKAAANRQNGMYYTYYHLSPPFPLSFPRLRGGGDVWTWIVWRVHVGEMALIYSARCLN